jgi:hypothetical protein
VASQNGELLGTRYPDVHIEPTGGNMSTNRLIWILWCLAWTAFWTFLALATAGFTLILAGLSLLAILAPVGKPRPTTPPRMNWVELRKSDTEDLSGSHS